MCGYGILFRGVGYAVQGTALGVAAAIGIGDSAPLDPPPRFTPDLPRPSPAIDRPSVDPSDIGGLDAIALSATPTRVGAFLFEPVGDLQPPHRWRTSAPASPSADAPAAIAPAPESLVDASRHAAPALVARDLPLPPAPAATSPELPATALLPAALPLPADIVLAAPAAADSVPPGAVPPADAPFAAEQEAHAMDAGFPAFDADISAVSWLGDQGAQRQALAAPPDLERPGGEACPETACGPDGGNGPSSLTPDAAAGVSPMHAPLLDLPAGHGEGGVTLAAAAPRPEASELGQSAPAAEAPPPEIGPEGSTVEGEAQAKEVDLLSPEPLPRGGLALSGGYSSIEGPVGSIKLSRTNISGPGRDITALFRYSDIQTQAEVGYSDANFMGSRFAFAPTLFWSRSSAIGFGSDKQSSEFRQDARGANILIGKAIKGGFRATANYRFAKENFRIKDKDTVCDPALLGGAFCNALGRSRSSILSLALSLDRRNSAVDPTRGFQVRIVQDFAGPGGTSRYAKWRIGGTAYAGLGSDLVLSLGVEGGFLTSLGGREVPLFDRFYIGGNAMRGFDLRGLGPKVVPTAAAPGETTAIGGRAYYVARFEVSVRPGAGTNRFGITPSLFVDAGSVFGARKSDLAPGEVLIGNSAKPRVAVGIGVALNTPGGKFRINFAEPVVRQDGDRSKRFSISFGTAF